MTRLDLHLVRIALTALFAGTPAAAYAQDATRLVHFDPGHQVGRDTGSQTYAAGLGLERVLERHLAIQADIAAISYFEADESRKLGGIASVDGVLHFLPQRRVEPFAVIGYSLHFRDHTTNMFNYGAGLRHWFREDRALLVEIRDHRAKQDQPLSHFWSVRIGLVFR
jgi:hypothetical protein